MSSLRGYQHWATLGLINDASGQQKVLSILRNIRTNFPNQLNLQSAPSCDRLKRAISRRIWDIPGKVSYLHREDAVDALYELFKLCCIDWSDTGSANTEEGSGGSQEDEVSHENDSFFIGGKIENRETPFERLSNGSGYVLATVTGRLDTHAIDLVERQIQVSGYTHADCDSGHQCIPMNTEPVEHSHETAQNETTSVQQRRKKYDWDWFNYQHTNVIFNAFVDITWSPYPRCRETIRLSDMMGTSTNTHRTITSFARARHQDRSPDGDWIRLDSITLSRLCKQLQVIRSFDQEQDAIWWSLNPLNTTSLDSTEGQARIDNQRDLTWAVYRSFDAPWQEWRGRRLEAVLPSQENYPRFSIIIRDVDDLVDTSESMDTRSPTSSVCALFEGLGGSRESVCGDELADILSAIINEPLRPNGWASGPF
jgi:hypothetical protein